MNETLQFHIEANDYFGTLATVLDLVSQDLRKRGHRSNAEMLGRLRDGNGNPVCSWNRSCAALPRSRED